MSANQTSEARSPHLLYPFETTCLILVKLLFLVSGGGEGSPQTFDFLLSSRLPIEQAGISLGVWTLPWKRGVKINVIYT